MPAYERGLNQLCTAMSLPLTTPFTAPADCAQRFTPVTTSTNSHDAYQTLMQDLNDVACLPPGYSPQCSAYSYPTFSPGTCPYGYYTAYNIPLSERGTVAACCKSGFETGVMSSVCTKILYRETVTLVYNYTSTYKTTATVSTNPNVYTTTRYASTVFPTTTATFLDHAKQVMPAIWVAAKDGEISSSSLSPSSSPQPKSTRPSSQTGEPDQDTTTDADADTTALSTAAKTGIAVGVAVAIILLISALWVSWLRRRRGRPQAPGMIPADEWRKPELDGRRVGPVAEVDGDAGDGDGRGGVAELEGRGKPAELEGRGGVREGAGRGEVGER